jgi:hypothetical protein
MHDMKAEEHLPIRERHCRPVVSWVPQRVDAIPPVQRRANLPPAASTMCDKTLRDRASLPIKSGPESRPDDRDMIRYLDLGHGQHREGLANVGGLPPNC